MIEGIARPTGNKQADHRVEALKDVLRTIERIKMAISALEDEVSNLILDRPRVFVSGVVHVTPGGSVMGLDRAIEGFLRDNSAVLPSVRIAEELYAKNQVRLPYPAFKRRVVVTLSAMAKKKDAAIEAAVVDGEHVWRVKMTKATDEVALTKTTC
ncbi:MAG: hypothetical protein IPP83_04740 [Flavobacteriales bacterium]|nr:hypothetical protein [Flavobacteriales bacterium]